MSKKRGRPDTVRRKVLAHLIANGPKSPTQMHVEWMNELNQKNIEQSTKKNEDNKPASIPVIISVLSRLEKSGFIFKNKKGREIYCYISEKGLVEIIRDEKFVLLSEAFWIHLLYLLEHDRIEEQRSYEIIQEYVTKTLKADERYSYSKKIYSRLHKTRDGSEFNRLTKIFNKLRIIDQKKIIDSEKFYEMNNEDNLLDIEQLTDKISDGGQFIKFTLGKFGFLFMLNYYLILYRKNGITREKLRKDLSKIIEAKSFHFPMLFEKHRWNNLRISFGDRIEEILPIFDFMYRYDEDEDYLNEYRFFIEQRSGLIVNSQHEMSLSYSYKLENFWQSAKTVYKRWEDKSMLCSPFNSNIMLSDKVLQGIFQLKENDCKTIRVIDKIRTHNTLISQGLESDILAGYGEMQEDGTDMVIQEPIDEESIHFKDVRLNKILDIIYKVSEIPDSDLTKFEKGLTAVLKKYDFMDKHVYKKFIELYQDVEKFNKIRALWNSIIQRIDSTGVNEGQVPHRLKEYQSMQSNDAAQNIISFLFYTHLAYNHNSIFSNLLSHDKFLAQWYYGWLSKIQEFEDKKRIDIFNVTEEVRRLTGFEHEVH